MIVFFQFNISLVEASCHGLFPLSPHQGSTIAWLRHGFSRGVCLAFQWIWIQASPKIFKLLTLLKTFGTTNQSALTLLLPRRTVINHLPKRSPRNSWTQLTVLPIRKESCEIFTKLFLVVGNSSNDRHDKHYFSPNLEYSNIYKTGCV